MAEEDLTFQQAFKKAIEAAEKEAKDLQQHSTAPVNSIHGGKRMVPKVISTPSQDLRVPGIACHRCWGKHKATDCKFREGEFHLARKMATLLELAETCKRL